TPFSSHATAIRWAAFSDDMPRNAGRNRGRTCFSRIRQTPAMPIPLTSLGRKGFGSMRASISGSTRKLTKMRRSIVPRMTGMYMGPSGKTVAQARNRRLVAELTASFGSVRRKMRQHATGQVTSGFLLQQTVQPGVDEMPVLEVMLFQIAFLLKAAL